MVQEWKDAKAVDNTPDTITNNYSSVCSLNDEDNQNTCCGPDDKSTCCDYNQKVSRYPAKPTLERNHQKLCITSRTIFELDGVAIDFIRRKWFHSQETLFSKIIIFLVTTNIWNISIWFGLGWSNCRWPRSWKLEKIDGIYYEGEFHASILRRCYHSP